VNLRDNTDKDILDETPDAPRSPKHPDGTTRDLREANENIRKAQGDDAVDTAIDPKKTGNRPRFDRDR
jgi:hypothetical protein